MGRCGMEIFKPDKNKSPDCLDPDDDFFNHSHGMMNAEFTLCGIACEEWNYDKTEPRKKITCPGCLAVIRLCREYTLKNWRA
jgi:hypothetical protein